MCYWGRWGTTPWQNFIYVHLNWVINNYDFKVIYVSGPGHGGPDVCGLPDGDAGAACLPEILSSYRYEGDELRMITIAWTFEGLLAEAFCQSRESAEGNVGIMARILGAFETLADLTAKPRRRLAIREQAGRTAEAAHDRARIARWLNKVRETFGDKT